MADVIDAPRVSSEIVVGFSKLKADADASVKEAKKTGKKTVKKGGKKTEAELKKERKDELKKNVVMTEHMGSLDDLIEKLCPPGVKMGLTEAQITAKREEFGKNALTPPPQTPEWVKLLHAVFGGLFSMLLWAGGILCFIGYALRGDLDNLYLGAVLVVVVAGTGVFEYFQERSSNNLMESFRNMMPESINVMRDGAANDINAELLVPGDIILVKGGDKIPADARIVECSDDMAVEQASLTGEPDALPRKVEMTDENPLETANLIFFGTMCPAGTSTAIVVKTGDKTVMGQISKLATSLDAEQTPINKEIEMFVRIISSIAFVLGITFFIINFVLGADPIQNIVFMIGIIVANVPEGLLATVTVCLTLTAGRMATKMVLVKDLEAVETLGSTTCICSDKTGTLTINDMTVANVMYDLTTFETEDGLTNAADRNGGVVPSFPVIGRGDSDLSQMLPDWTEDSFTRIARCAAISNDAFFTKMAVTNPDTKVTTKKLFRSIKTEKDGSKRRALNWLTNGNASDSAMIKFTQDKAYFNEEVAAVIDELRDTDAKIARNACMGQGDATMDFDKDQNLQVNESNASVEKRSVGCGVMAYRSAYPSVKVGTSEWKIPFSSKNKFTMSCHRLATPGAPAIIMVKGAPERVIGRCDTMMLKGKMVDFTEERRMEVEKQLGILMSKGRRCLAMAELELDAEKYPEDFEFKIDGSSYNFPMGEPRDTEEAVGSLAMEGGSLGIMDYNAKVTEENKNKKAGTPDRALKPEVSMEKLCFLGFMALIDPPRAAVPGAVAKCKTAGIRVVMVTGDHPGTAEAIAKEVGIIWGDTQNDCLRHNKEFGLVKGDKDYKDPDHAPAVVVPGHTFDTDTPQARWDDILSRNQIVFARTSPQQKLVIVENFKNWEKNAKGTWQRRSLGRGKEIVAVTGDGVNDAPALKAANIGVAMGIMGSQVSKDAADMILLDDNFASIVAGVEEGRLIFDNLKKSIAYTLSSNIPEIAPFLSYIVLGIPLPLSTLLILCIDLGTDLVPAISMAWEDAEADIMRRMPRNSEVDHLVTFKLISFAYLQIGVIQAVAGFYCWLTVMSDYGYPPHILPTLGATIHDNWQKNTLYCQVTNGVFRNFNGEAYRAEDWAMLTTKNGARGFESTNADHFLLAQQAQNEGHYFWDPYGERNELPEGFPYQVKVSDRGGNLGINGDVTGCDYPLKNYGGKYIEKQYDSEGKQVLTTPSNEGSGLKDYSTWFAADGGSISEDSYIMSGAKDKEGVAYKEGDSLKGEQNWRDNWRSYEGYTYNEPQQTVQSITNLHKNGFLEYLPYKARMSNFFDARWLAWPRKFAGPGVGIPGMGLATDDQLYFNNGIQGLWYNDAVKGGLAVLGDGGSSASTAHVDACEEVNTRVSTASTDAQRYSDMKTICNAIVETAAPYEKCSWVSTGKTVAGQVETTVTMKEMKCTFAGRHFLSDHGESSGAGNSLGTLFTTDLAARFVKIAQCCKHEMAGESINCGTCDEDGQTMLCPCKSPKVYNDMAVNEAQLGVFKGRYTDSSQIGNKSPANTYPRSLHVGDELKSFVPSMYTWADSDTIDLSSDTKWKSYRYDKVYPPCTAAQTNNAISVTTKLFTFCVNHTAGSASAVDYLGNVIESISSQDLNMYKARSSSMLGNQTINAAVEAKDVGTVEESELACDPADLTADCTVYTNVASRMLQKEALHYAQTAGLICIIIVQWADLMICKTRWLSIRQQGMTNPVMNFGLLFETVLGAFLCYVTPIGSVLGTRPLRFTHWLPGVPFSIFIFLYDEIRKNLMRGGPCGLGSKETRDPVTSKVTRAPGWLEKWTYY